MEWLLVGLGNPGVEYELTRHNMGFLVVDWLADQKNAPVRRLKHKSLTGTMTLGGKKTLVMKPQTYMNRSGAAVGEAARFYQIPPQRVLVLVDDVALPMGALRIRGKGSAGGHNGLKDLIAHLGTEEFPRIRMGVGGKPHPDYDLADWVLAPMKGEDWKVAKNTISRAADAVEAIIRDGLDVAGQKYNR